MTTKSETKQDDSPMRLSVTNFGPIAEAEIELRPLTVFVGPSNTGKSYLAILLYALHRIFKERVDSFLVDYEYELFRKSIRANNEIKNSIIEWAAELTEKNDKHRQSSKILPHSVASIVYRALNAVKFSDDKIFSEIVRCFGINDIPELIRHSASETSISIAKQAYNSEKPFEFNMNISRSANSFTTLFPEENQLQFKVNENSNWKRALREINRYGHSDISSLSNFASRHIFTNIIDNIFAEIISPFHFPSHYFPASRTGVVEASYAIQGALYDRISRAGIEPINVPLLSGIIADFLPKMDPDFLQRSKSPSKTLLRHAKKMEEKVMEGRLFISDSKNSSTPAFYFQQGNKQNNIDKAIPLTIASSMVTELAPIILYLRYLIHDNDVLIIEEPEAHLHPAKQVEFTRQLASLVQNGIRIIITTHSEWVLEALTNIVQISELSVEQRNGLPSEKFSLDPHQVGVWLFKPKNRTRGSIVKAININNKSDAFPADYDEVMDALYNEWAETANRKGE